MVADRLAPFARWVVDCGGDIRVGGVQEIEIAHPLRDEPAARRSSTTARSPRQA